MGRIAKSIIIDEAVWDEYQTLFPRRASQFVEEQLRMAIGSKKGDARQLNLQLLNKQLLSKTQELEQTSKDVTYLKEQIVQITKLKEEEEIKRLEMEKLQLEEESKKNHCQSCNKEIKEPIKYQGKEYRLCLQCLYALKDSSSLVNHAVGMDMGDITEEGVE